MTISSTSSRVVYSGDGFMTSFGFAFYVSDQADLVVTYTDSAGNQTVIAPGAAPTGYQISAPAVPAPGWPAGGTIGYNPGSPIAAGTTLTIQRVVAGTQPTTLSNQGAFWPQVIEKALDRVVTIVQGFIDQVSLSLRVSPADVAALNPLPPLAVRKNTVLGFDGNGQPYPAVITASLVSVNPWLVSNFLGAASSSAAACTALGAFFPGGNNTASGTNDFTAGRIKVPPRSLGDSGSDAASTNFVAATVASQLGGVVPRGYLGGLTIANDGSSPNSVLDIAAGVCADSTNTYMIPLATFTKSTGGSFVAGSGSNGLGQGLSLAASTWYHVFAVLVNNTPDVFFDTSPTAANKPAGTGAFRRIGSFKTDASVHILPFTQLGDEFLWKTAPALDISTSNPGTSAASNTLASVPPGVQVGALLNVGLAVGGVTTGLLVSPLDITDQAPSLTASPGVQLQNDVANTTTWGPLAMRTDTGARIRTRLTASDANTIVKIAVQGWIDRRGRDN